MKTIIHKALSTLLVAVAMCAPTTVEAQYSVSQAKNMAGLSNNSVLCVFQDRYNFVWFGTYDGLNRYDGRNVNVSRFELGKPKSISSNIIEAIVAADGDYLWLLSPLGLDKYNIKAEKVDEVYRDINSSWSIASNADGNTFVSIGKQVKYYDIRSKKFLPMNCPGWKATDVQSLFADEYCNLWILQADGVMQKVAFSLDDDGVIKADGFSAINTTVHDTFVKRAFLKGDTFFLLDTDNCLYSYDIVHRNKALIRNLSEEIKSLGAVSGVIEDGNDILVSFISSGVIKLVKAADYATEIVQTNVGVFAICADRNQPLVWMCTDGSGVQIYKKADKQFNQILSKQIPYKTNKPIRSLFTDSNDCLWVGTKGDGIIKIRNYDKYTDGQPIPLTDVTHLGTNNGLLDNQVFTIQESIHHKNLIWIATRGPGLNYYTRSDNKIHAMPYAGVTYVHTIFEENDSVLWLASSQDGLIRVLLGKQGGELTIKSKQNFTFQLGQYKSNEIYAFTYDGRGSFYIGCRGGLGVAKFDIATHKTTFMSDVAKNEISAVGDVICMLNPSDTVLYYGASSGMGKIRFRSGVSAVTQYSRSNGMYNDMIHGLLAEDDGELWMSTNKGLIKYSPTHGLFHNYTRYDGEVTEFCDNACYQCQYTHRLFFGGINGVMWVEPRPLERSAYVPDIYFVGLTVAGEKVNLFDKLDKKERLVLGTNESTFAVQFVALDYLNMDDIEYSYMLEGYDTQWVNAGQENKASFVNVPYGHYTLKVRCQSGQEFEDIEYKELDIIVKAPWFLTIWAFLAYALALIAIMCLAYLFAKRTYRRKQHELASHLRERQQEQLYKERLDFFTNITHEFCTPLTIIKGVCDMLTNRSTSDKAEKKYIETLNTNANYLNDLVQELLEFRQIEEGAFRKIKVQKACINSIVERWTSAYEEIAKNNDIDFTINVFPEKLYWNTDTSCLGKVLTNLISNAFKYTSDEGCIRLMAEERNGKLHISVYNTGRGMSDKERQMVFNRYAMLNDMSQNGYREMADRHGLGLAICKKMVEMLHGEITLDSVVNQYAKFTVELPKLDLDGNVIDAPTDDVAAPAATPAAVATAENTATTTDVALADAKPMVLVVDDNPDILWLINSVLCDEYRVLQAANVDDASTMIKKHLPAAIITDIMMPGINGIQFIKMIRSDRYTANIPIIIVSAKVGESDHVEGLNMGADAYLTKPFSPAVLKSVVARFINREKADRNYYTSPESAFTLNEGIVIHNNDKEFLDKVTAFIAANIEDENALRPADIAAELGMDTRTLYRKFKKISPLTPNDFVKNYRYTYATKLLLSTNLSIQEIIYKVGVSNKTSFYADFKKMYGMTPTEYRMKK